MKNIKTWAISVLALTICGLVAFSAIIIFIDPYFQYHKPFDKVAYVIDNQSYQNPGIAKNFEYDAVVTGSSMTENFKTSLFKKHLNVEAIKVPFSGATAKNLSIILSIALKENDEIKSVFLGLDYYAMEANPNNTRHYIPLYLYDNNMFNDVSYVFNKDILFGSTMQIL